MKLRLLIISFVLMIVLGIPMLIPAHHHRASAPTPLKTIAIAKQTYRGLPSRLLIPKLGIDARVEYDGRTDGGDMAVPASATSVGWYKYGALPGEVGSAVMGGHVVGSRGEPGVFMHLSSLQVGDVIKVIDAKGQISSFSVRSSAIYDPAHNSTVVFNSTSGTHLNLITCAGDWDAATQHYLSRLVVFADKTN